MEPPQPPRAENVASWDTHAVGKWLEEMRFQSLRGTFRENHIDGAVLLELRPEHLRDLEVPQAAELIRLADAVRRLRAQWIRAKVNAPVWALPGPDAPDAAPRGKPPAPKKGAWKSHAPVPPHIITPRSSSMKNHSASGSASAASSAAPPLPSAASGGGRLSAGGAASAGGPASAGDASSSSEAPASPPETSARSDGSFDGFRASAAQPTQPAPVRPYGEPAGDVRAVSPTSPGAASGAAAPKESIWRRLGKGHRGPAGDAAGRAAPGDGEPPGGEAGTPGDGSRFLRVIGNGNHCLLLDVSRLAGDPRLLRETILQRFGIPPHEWASHALLRPPRDNDAEKPASTKISDAELAEIARNPRYLAASDAPESSSPPREAIYLRKQHVFAPGASSQARFPAVLQEAAATVTSLSSSDDEASRYKKKDLYKYFGENISAFSGAAAAPGDDGVLSNPSSPLLSRERTSSLNTRFSSLKSGDSAGSSTRSRLFGRPRHGSTATTSTDGYSAATGMSRGTAAPPLDPLAPGGVAVPLTPTNARKIESLMGAPTHQIFGERPSSETIAGNLEKFFGKVSKPLQHKINEQVRMSRMSRAMDWQSTFQSRLSQRQSQLYDSARQQRWFVDEPGVGARRPTVPASVISSQPLGPLPPLQTARHDEPRSSTSPLSHEVSVPSSPVRDSPSGGDLPVKVSTTVEAPREISVAETPRSETAHTPLLASPMSASPDSFGRALPPAEAMEPPQTADGRLLLPLSALSSSSGLAGTAMLRAAEGGVLPAAYQLGQVIGQGSFGKVYLAVALESGQLMAVKQVELPTVGTVKAQAKRQKMVDALMREIEVLKMCQHPNIVQYLGTDNDGNYINVFLEYVSGGSVSTLLQRIGKFEESLVRHLVPQILLGLEYLHDKALIHRDIKGANILITERGDAKISDFGISKKNEYQLAYRFNSRMSVQGSVFWMAPEVVKAKGYSAKVDIWSLGCVVLEMYTGSHPWRKFDEVAAMYRIGTMNAPPVPPSLSAATRAFLALCFTINPEQRPTASELLDDPFSAPSPDFDFSVYYERSVERHLREQQQPSGPAPASLSDDYSDSGSRGGSFPSGSRSGSRSISSSGSRSGSRSSGYSESDYGERTGSQSPSPRPANRRASSAAESGPRSLPGSPGRRLQSSRAATAPSSPTNGSFSP